MLPSMPLQSASGASSATLECVAVVSYARMDPANLGQPPDAAVLETRLRKMISKNIGILYYGLPSSDNPRSAMFRNIMGVDHLDRLTEDFRPK